MTRSVLTLWALVGALTLTACVGSVPTPSGEGGERAGIGPITFATGKDLTGYLRPLLDQWNSAHPSEHATLLEVAEDADDQRAQLVTNLQRKSDRYDVISLDVVWTAEFAEAGWIVPI